MTDAKSLDCHRCPIESFGGNVNLFRPDAVPIVVGPVVFGSVASHDEFIVFRAGPVDQLDVKKTVSQSDSLGRISRVSLGCHRVIWIEDVDPSA